jgi:hypothetical protein
MPRPGLAAGRLAFVQPAASSSVTTKTIREAKVMALAFLAPPEGCAVRTN